VQAEELARLRAEHRELLRLRGEVTRLRQEVKASARLAQPEQPSTSVSQVRPDPSAEVMAFATNAAATFNDLKQLALGARIFANSNEDRLPTTFEQITNYLGVAADRFRERYEFVQHPRPISVTEPQLSLFREIAPRQRPDGKWEKAYALCDGSVATQVFPTTAIFRPGKPNTRPSTPPTSDRSSGLPASEFVPA
jgi:hypothetical protein